MLALHQIIGGSLTRALSCIWLSGIIITPTEPTFDDVGSRPRANGWHELTILTGSEQTVLRLAHWQSMSHCHAS